jgi:hypothetical protein
MTVKSARLVRVGGTRPPPITTFTVTSKGAVYTPGEWADTITLFHLYQYMYSVGIILRVLRYTMFTSQTSFKPLLLKGGGEDKILLVEVTMNSKEQNS